MRVIATRMGYYNDRRIQVGEVFDLKKDIHFSDADRETIHPGWMKKYVGKAEPIDFEADTKEIPVPALDKRSEDLEASDVKSSKKKAKPQDDLVI